MGLAQFYKKKKPLNRQEPPKSQEWAVSSRGVITRHKAQNINWLTQPKVWVNQQLAIKESYLSEEATKDTVATGNHTLSWK